MIRKLVKISMLLSIVLGGGWYLVHRQEIDSFSDAMNLLRDDSRKLMSTFQNRAWDSSGYAPRKVLRIASFDLHDFHDGKLDAGATGRALVEILGQFDVIALQGIESPDHGTLPRLMDHLHQEHPHFDYVIGPRSSHTAHHHQFAFIYNRQVVELERSEVYTVQDPDDVLSHDPLVGWFRTRGDREQAFTFTLVNINMDPTNKAIELGYLQKIKLAVKGDGRYEDDILLIGNFQENSITLLNRNLLPGCDYVIRQDTTDLAGQRQLSNIAFPISATTEFTGRAGVHDFLTHQNLSLEQARQVSRHLPVWAEFFTQEGKASGYVAGISR